MTTPRQNQTRPVKQPIFQSSLPRRTVSQTQTPRQQLSPQLSLQSSRQSSRQQPTLRLPPPPISLPPSQYQQPSPQNPYPPPQNLYLPPQASLPPPSQASLRPPSQASLRPPSQASLRPPSQASLRPPSQASLPPPSQASLPPSSQASLPTPPQASSPPPLPATVTNDSKDIYTGNGITTAQNSIEQPSSIPQNGTTEKLYLDYLNDYVVDWKEPGDLETVKSPRFPNSGRISPLLRPIGTPPSLVSYQNRYNLRQTISPLPAITTSRFSVPDGLDTLSVNSLGLDQTDYYNLDLDSYGRQPSLLSHYKVTSEIPKQIRPLNIELHLNLAPLTVSNNVGTFSLPSARKARAQTPTPQLERLDSFILPRVEHEPTKLEFVPHEAFTNHYVEDFIGTCIEDQFLPDILHETINELGHEKKKRTGSMHRHVVDPFFIDTDKHIDQNSKNNIHLISDDWINDLGHPQRLRIPAPVSDTYPDIYTTRRIHFKEAPPMRINTSPRFHDSTPDEQRYTLTDYNPELNDPELNDTLRDLSRHNLVDRSQPVIVVVREVRDDRSRSPVHQGQYKSIEKYAKNKLLDTMSLDNLINRARKQPASESLLDYDDQSRLLDATILNNLIRNYKNRDEFQ